MTYKKMVATLAASSFLALAATPSYALPSRTWVSGHGDDANPCSWTAPCKTFAGAISKTEVNGEISVMDSAGYGAVTITKSISIVAEGAEGSILATNTTGVIINGSNIVVSLKGINFEGGGTGNWGVKILNAKSVTIDDCVIRGFRNAPGLGVSVATTAPDTRVLIKDTRIEHNNGGLNSNPNGGFARTWLDNVVVAHQGGIGISANNSEVLLSNTLVTDNAQGISASGGVITTFKNNIVARNTVDGAFNNTDPLD